jgi:hypothetical protein
MPESIVVLKIREALAATGNNRHDAAKLLLTWAIRDPALLLGLTKPHLKAIASGAVDHYLRTSGKKRDDDGGDNLPRSAIDDIVASAVQSTPRDKRRSTALPPPKSTERQASTMRRLAAAFTKKKDS